MKKKILIVARSADLLRNLQSFLQAKGYEVLAVAKDQDALNHLRESGVDLLLIGGQVELASRKSIRYWAETNRPNIKIVEHNGGTFKLDVIIATALASA